MEKLNTDETPPTKDVIQMAKDIAKSLKENASKEVDDVCMTCCGTGYVRVDGFAPRWEGRRRCPDCW